ncbi:MAG: hypothetical protein JO362_06200 [Streptomycetaceae bacterium]|nr:hypothetical protein [Streptomycetaceae bacterium]
MPVLDTTDRDTALTTTVPAAGDDPLRQLEYEPELPTGPLAIRCINHPQEISLRGIPVLCSACRARRDWLLINQGRTVWVRCRCGNQWTEPEITRADFDALVHTPEMTIYPSVEEAIAAAGFDGALAGIYLL